MGNFFAKLKSYMMPISMIIGIVFSSFLQHFSFITPFLIFTMLFVTYCSIELKDIKLAKHHVYLLIIQIVGSILVYVGIAFYDPVIAQGVMICILTPTATSAVVITGMLGGKTASLTAYSLMSNITVAIVAPVFFALIGDQEHTSFLKATLVIGEKIILLLILPFILALLLRRFAQQVHRIVMKSQAVSFYLWNIALILVTAQIIQFIKIEESRMNHITLILIGTGSLIACCLQFFVGKTLGTKYDDRIASGQGLGQKNTVLAIWMAQTYLNPISSIGPGTYVLWQNVINSYQVWKKGRKSNHQSKEI